MALSGSRGAFLALPTLVSLSLVWPPFLGASSLASPGLLGAVMVVVFLGWIFLVCLGTNCQKREGGRIQSQSFGCLKTLHSILAWRKAPFKKEGEGDGQRRRQDHIPDACQTPAPNNTFSPFTEL